MGEFRYVPELGDNGFPYVEPEPKSDLHVHALDDQVVITGNREGLLMLAKFLVSLAEFEPNKGFHFHLDSGRRLDKESLPVVIYRLPMGR